MLIIIIQKKNIFLLERMMKNMIKSMTGFGRGENSDDIHSFNVEIKTVNHRYSDIFIRMPKHLNYLEEDIKKLIKNRVARGRVEVFINLDYSEGASLDVSVDIALARAYRDALQELQEELSIVDPLSISSILKFPDVIRTERKEVDEDEVWETLEPAISDALDELVLMREKEGLLLCEDIKEQLAKVEGNLRLIESRSKLVVEEYRDRLEERVRELLDDNMEIDEERLHNELVFFADRSDINEELVRFNSHIEQLVTNLEEDDSVGRRLDFLIQEMNREVNTIGSKTNDIEISQAVVNIKSEIEKIREQVQNIE